MDKTCFAQNYESQDLRGRDFSGHKFYHCIFDKAISDETTKWYGAEWHCCRGHYFNAAGSVFDRFLMFHCDMQRGNFAKTRWIMSRAMWTDFTWATFKGADIATLETEKSNFYLARVQDAARVNMYAREVIGEIIRFYSNGDQRALELAAFIKDSPEICWREYMEIAALPSHKEVSARIFDVLKNIPVIRERMETKMLDCHKMEMEVT